MIYEILNILVILQVGLTSGLLFIFTVAVNPGLAKLNEEEYYRAMKFINQVILNPIFFFSVHWASNNNANNDLYE